MATTERNSQKPIFVSHASADEALVGKFVDDLLLPGLDITTKEVFCTSLEGMKIPAGKNFVEFVKEQIQSPKVVLMLLTPNYFDRVFCCCEMGASWAMSHEGIPILVPPLDYDALEAVLKTTQAVKIDQKNGLNEIKDRVIEKLGLQGRSTARWEQRRDQFLAELPGVLARLPPPRKVEHSQYERLQEKYVLQIEELKHAHETVKEREALIEDLCRAKDKGDVEDIIRRHSNCWEAFGQLCGQATAKLNRLPSIVAEILFHELGGHTYVPPTGGSWDVQNTWEKIRDGEKNGYLVVDLNDEVRTNGDDPSVASATEALEKVEAFLNGGMDEYDGCHEFEIEYAKQYEHQPSFASKRFWQEKLGL